MAHPHYWMLMPTWISIRPFWFLCCCGSGGWTFISQQLHQPCQWHNLLSSKSSPNQEKIQLKHVYKLVTN